MTRLSSREKQLKALEVDSMNLEPNSPVSSWEIYSEPSSPVSSWEIYLAFPASVSSSAQNWITIHQLLSHSIVLTIIKDNLHVCKEQVLSNGRAEDMLF